MSRINPYTGYPADIELSRSAFGSWPRARLEPRHLGGPAPDVDEEDHRRVEVAGRLYEGPTKTEQERVVPLPQFLVGILGEHLARREREEGRPLSAQDWVFTGVGGQALRTKWFREAVVRPSLRAAGLPHEFRTYDFRHAHASQVIVMGASPLAVKERLGHADILTTFRRYGHLFKGVQEKLALELEDKHAEAQTLAAERNNIRRLRPAVDE